MTGNTMRQAARVAVALTAVMALSGHATAQTKIKADSNKYKPAQDVQIGQEAAAQFRKELPLLNDKRLDDWVEGIGQRLVAAIPAEFTYSEFRYTFEVVNQKEINAFALPGGPMFLNRGMIEAGNAEAEVAGVMAHEIAHVALRHGTAQATKGEKFQIGAVLGQIAGAVVGGTAGSIIAQGSQVGLGTYFLKFGRAAESQADILGAQMLARAGYDPRQMANMFKTIEAEGGGSRQPEFMSSHPNPGNRFNAINKEAASLKVVGNADTGQFAAMKSRLAGMSPALTAAQIAAQKKDQAPAATSTGTGRTTVRVEPPAGRERTYRPAPFLRVTVPSNWQQQEGRDGVTYAPEGGFVRDSSGRTATTHGLQIGVAQGGSGSLQRDTEAVLQGFARSNPSLRSVGSRREALGGRTGLTTILSNVSDVSGQPETVAVSTTQLKDGTVLFVVGVSPREEADVYEAAFKRVRQVIQITE